VTPEQIERLIAATEKISDALAAIANRMPSQAGGGYIRGGEQYAKTSNEKLNGGYGGVGGNPGRNGDPE